MLRLATQPKKDKRESLSFLTKPLGMNTVLGPNQLEADELVYGLNWMYSSDGKPTTRPGTEVITNTALPEGVIYNTEVTIGATSYTLLVDESYNLYYLDSSYDPVFIGLLEGKPTIHEFESYAVIMDTGYLKTWDGTTFRMAYDEGTGTRGYQFDNTSGTTAGSIAVGNGTNYRAATKFTSQTWTAGYTLLPTTAIIKLEREGAPTGAFYIRLRRSSDDFILAENLTITEAVTNDIVSSVSDISVDATNYTVTFTVTSEMVTATDYYLSVEYTRGDAANYIKVHYTTATAGATYTYPDGVWTLDLTKTIMASLQPGKPPKASFGIVTSDRLHFAGDSDHPGWEWYTNVNTPYDTSTTDGGGYVGVIDNDAYTFPIGGMILLFQQIWIIGKQEHPFFAVLSGAEPADYTFTEKFRFLDTVHHVVVNGINNGFFANKTGVYSLVGVQEYGDIRLGGLASPIRNIFNGYFSTNAFAGFDPSLGLYMIKLENRSETWVCHTGIQVKVVDGVRSPWLPWEFPYEPMSFSFADGEMRIGAADGHLYKLNPLVFSDDGTRPNYTMTSAMVEMPIADAELTNVFLSGKVHGDSGTFDLEFYYPTDDSMWELETGWTLETGWEFETETAFAIEFDSTVTPFEDNPDYITNKVQWSIDNVTLDKLDLANVTILFRRMQE